MPGSQAWREGDIQAPLPLQPGLGLLPLHRNSLVLAAQPWVSAHGKQVPSASH